MKKITLLLALIFALAVKIHAQIPNNGFENWTSFGTYDDPSFWGSTNSSSGGQFYAITKSTDHFPTSIGQYSVRVENNISYNPNNFARGFLATGPPPPAPDFPITGHPTSLTGYYKFIPQNGDTMTVQIQLYANGNSVAFASFTSTDTVPQWTPFTLSIPNYLSADSASIIISAYYANGFQYLPHGNSVLYLDNLNFDNLITAGIPDFDLENSLSVSPNPFSSMTKIETAENLTDATLSVYNLYGQEVKQINKLFGKEINLCRDHLPTGLYFFKIIQENKVIASDKIVITD